MKKCNLPHKQQEIVQLSQGHTFSDFKPIVFNFKTYFFCTVIFNSYFKLLSSQISLIEGFLWAIFVFYTNHLIDSLKKHMRKVLNSRRGKIIL